MATYKGRQVHGVVLVQSSDYWHYRFHLAQTPVALMVCIRHDSILSVDVLSLEDGREYGREDLPKKYETLGAVKSEHSRHAAKVLVGAVLCGVKEAHDLLQAMPESTRRKYKAKMHEYQRRVRGPFTSRFFGEEAKDGQNRMQERFFQQFGRVLKPVLPLKRCIFTFFVRSSKKSSRSSKKPTSERVRGRPVAV